MKVLFWPGVGGGATQLTLLLAAPANFMLYCIHIPVVLLWSQYLCWIAPITQKPMQKVLDRISSLFIRLVRCFSPPMFHIVGCNHGIQVGTGGFADFDGEIANEQRAHFRALLQSICDDRGTNAIFEEDGGPEMTAGEQLAIERGLPWYDVNTSNADKQAMGIPADYAVTGSYSAGQKDQWNRQREEFMANKIRTLRGNAKTFLVICGFTHMNRMAELLRRRRAMVFNWDYRNLSWYKNGVFDDDP